MWIVSYGAALCTDVTYSTHHSNHWNKDSQISSAAWCLPGDKESLPIYQHSNFLWCLVVCSCKHVPSVLVPCLRPSRWLVFLPGPVEQTVLKGSPSVHLPAAPPAGWLQCWPEHWSLPESSALDQKTAQMEKTVILNVDINVYNIKKTVHMFLTLIYQI